MSGQGLTQSQRRGHGVRSGYASDSEREVQVDSYGAWPSVRLRAPTDLVRLLQQQDELHAYGGQSSTVRAVEAAVAQEHPEQGLVGLQPQPPAALALPTRALPTRAPHLHGTYRPITHPGHHSLVFFLVVIFQLTFLYSTHSLSSNEHGIVS